MPPERRIKKDQIWAYRRSPSAPIQKVRILDPGPHTYADIRAEVVDDRWKTQVVGKKNRYPCLWEDLEQYIEKQRIKGEQMLAERQAEQEKKVLDAEEKIDGLQVSVPELLAVAIGQIHSMRIAYPLDWAAEELGVSPSFLRTFVTRGDLTVHYANSKMIILREDLLKWVRSLPTERK